jgi:hypothetical protein
MAKIITFLPKATYIGGGTASIVTISEIFEVTEERNFAVQLRVYATQPDALIVTGSIETTSDPTFLDASWKTVSGTFMQTGIGNRFVAISGSVVQRFVRGKLEVPTNGTVFAMLSTVARE